MTQRIAVIGGGISGLSAANKLIGSGHEVHVLESTDKIGGKLKSEHADGFLSEGGADSFVASRPRIVSLCEELGLKEELMPPTDPRRRAYIFRKGSLYPIPEGFSGLVPTRFQPIIRSKLLSPLGKLRLMAEPRVPVRNIDGDESLKTFAIRRFGIEAYDRLLEPLLNGISSSSDGNISLAASFPHWKIAELEYGSVIKGLTAARPGEASNPRVSGFLTLRNGMASLANAFIPRFIDGNVQLKMNTRVRTIQGSGDGYLLRFGDGTTHHFDGVVVAVATWDAAELLRNLAPEVSRALREIPQNSAGIVSLGYDNPAIADRLKGNGYLVPSSENRVSGGTTWSSSKWSNRAPGASSLIRVYFGRGPGGDIVERDDDVLVEAARTELRESLGIVADPTITRVTRWIDSLPQYTIGHMDRIGAIEQGVGAHRGLAIAGHMLRGVGIPVCVQTGEVAASRVLESLTSPS